MLVLAAVVPLSAEVPPETPTRTFTGTERAGALLANLDFADVRASNSFAREAVWETGALELMKGYGAKRFGLGDTLSIEQALAIAYVAAGREAEAQAAAETLDAARAADAKLFPAPKMWSDGYIQLAFNDGLLTQAQYADALQTDQLALTGANFLRKASVTREDMAYYMAGTLGLAPLYPQTRLFNAYADWQAANPVRIPAIEAMLQNRVMHGDANGRFRPKGFLSRAEAAQMLQNAEPVLFPKLGLTKYKGVVEGVDRAEDNTSGVLVKESTVRIRNTDGTLHTLVLREPAAALETDRNEQNGATVLRAAGTIVSAGGVPQSGKVLSAGQQVVYVADSANQIPYMQVLSGTNKTILLGRVKSIDGTTRAMTFQPYQELPFADLRLVDPETIRRMSTGTDTVRHIVSAAAKIYSGEVQMTLAAVEPDAHAIIVVEGGLINYIEPVNLDILQQDGVVAGIIADVNPSLGYVTLYAADGSGLSSGIDNGFAGLRNYSFAGDVAVTRDGRDAPVDALMPGDSVFLKLDADGGVTAVGAANDHEAVYGTISKKGTASLTLLDETGATRTYAVPAEVPVFRDGLPADRSAMAVGDRVRLLVQTNGAFSAVSEVRLERDPTQVANLYRGTYVWYDPLRRQIAVTGAQTFTGGRWLAAPQNGAMAFTLATEYAGSLPPERAAGTAYFAVSEDAGGTERVAALAIRTADRYEKTYDDTIATTSTDGATFSLTGSAQSFAADAGTLVVKDGRLVSAAALLPEERARLSAGRVGTTGRMLADVVVSETPTGAEGLSVYRGRISDITTESAFSLESFARLDGTSWTFFNTPKTFSIRTDATRLLSDGGVAGLRGFVRPDWIGASVYVLTDGTFAAAISDAPYGEIVRKARVSSVNGATWDEFGMPMTQPTALALLDSRQYDPVTHAWTAVADGDLTVPGDMIVVRKGKQAMLSDIRPGDTVRVLLTAAGGDARVILAE